MQERNRYRVTGSLFILALLVIFIPMLFDGEGVSRDMRSIPARPGQPGQTPKYSDVVPTSDVVAQVNALHDEIDVEGFSTEHGTRFGHPRLTVSNAQTSIWAVQAGSFAKLDNAQKFRTSVRDLQLEAFISTVKSTEGKIRHRVAVGPLMDATQATAIRQQITQTLSVDAQIVEMHP